MASVIQCECPGCHDSLRIPDEWQGRKIRCKHCGISFVAKARLSPPPAATVKPTTPAPPQGSSRPATPVKPAERDAFAFAGSRKSSSYRPNANSWQRPLALGLFAIVTVSAGAIGFFFPDLFGVSKRSSETQPAKDSSSAALAPAPPKSPADSKLPKDGKPVDLIGESFPRRMLAISVNNYVYANPTSGGKGGRGTADGLRLFANRLRVPKDQFYLVTDGQSDSEARPPLKAIIQESILKFLASSRPQDRVILVFAGHAIDVAGEPQLVPLEGDFAAKDTLIPLAWVYDRLKECPARQKVFVVDVCRLDSAHGLERPGSGPMAEKLDAMLATPPEGVQVWSSCVAKQYSYEYDFAVAGNLTVSGSAFLGLLSQAFQLGGGVQRAEDSIPLDYLTKAVNGAVSQLAKARENAEQTPRLSGSEKPSDVQYDPAEPLAARIELPTADMILAGGRADPKLVQSIFAEIAVPPLRLPRGMEKSPKSPDEQAALLARIFPFQADALKGCEADYSTPREFMQKKGQYPLREAVVRAVDTLDRQGRLNKVKIGEKESNADRLIEDFRGTTTDDVKKSLTKTQQDGPALMLVELEDAHESLLKAGKDRSKETSRRWQANYDYVLAQLKMRMVYVNEYNMVIAKVKKDELPALTPNVHKGWRLAATEKIQSPKEVKDLASDAKKLMAKVIKDYPGTPWEVLARREQSAALGLAWQATSFANE